MSALGDAARPLGTDRAREPSPCSITLTLSHGGAREQRLGPAARTGHRLERRPRSSRAMPGHVDGEGRRMRRPRRLRAPSERASRRGTRLQEARAQVGECERLVLGQPRRALQQPEPGSARRPRAARLSALAYAPRSRGGRTAQWSTSGRRLWFNGSLERDDVPLARATPLRRAARGGARRLPAFRWLIWLQPLACCSRRHGSFDVCPRDGDVSDREAVHERDARYVLVRAHFEHVWLSSRRATTTCGPTSSGAAARTALRGAPCHRRE